MEAVVDIATLVRQLRISVPFLQCPHLAPRCYVCHYGSDILVWWHMSTRTHWASSEIQFYLTRV